MNNKIKIVDVSTLIPGPFASFLLGKYLNAKILKIEDINQPDALANMRPSENGIGLGYSAINSGKTLLKLDMRKDGVEKIKHEVKDANVFIENFKTGRAYKLGIGYEDLVTINPKLIYCSISGYPPNHPLSKKSAHDLNILSLSGYLDQQSQLGELTALPPLLLADIFTAYHTSVRILSCLLGGKEKEHLQISMFESFQDAMMFSNYPQVRLKKNFSPNDYIMSGKFPCYCLYKSKDGGIVAVATLEKSLWIDFCHHLKHEDWVEQQFNPNLTSIVAEEMRKHNRFDWLQAELDFCVTPVLSVNEAVRKKYV